MRSISLMMLLLVAACASGPAGMMNAGNTTSHAIFEMLRSEDEAEVRAALAAVEAGPGAYLPCRFHRRSRTWPRRLKYMGV
ncbi:MAG: hypothetical protein ABL871_04315 [Terricaulis sp.]